MHLLQCGKKGSLVPLRSLLIADPVILLVPWLTAYCHPAYLTYMQSTSWEMLGWRNQRSNCQHPLDHQKSKRVPEKHLFLLYLLSKAFNCVDHNKLWKILQEMGIYGNYSLCQHFTYFVLNFSPSFSLSNINTHLLHFYLNKKQWLKKWKCYVNWSKAHYKW